LETVNIAEDTLGENRTEWDSGFSDSAKAGGRDYSPRRKVRPELIWIPVFRLKKQLPPVPKTLQPPVVSTKEVVSGKNASCQEAALFPF
jgi:hypothetical protein